MVFMSTLWTNGSTNIYGIQFFEAIDIYNQPKNHQHKILLKANRNLQAIRYHDKSHNSFDDLYGIQLLFYISLLPHNNCCNPTAIVLLECFVQAMYNYLTNHYIMKNYKRFSLFSKIR